MTESETINAAAKLVEQLNGDYWEPYVWENLGWHYCARNGFLTVSPFCCRQKISYYCLASVDGSMVDEAYWHESDSFYDDPNEAVIQKLKAMRKFLNKITQVFESAQTSIL